MRPAVLPTFCDFTRPTHHLRPTNSRHDLLLSYVLLWLTWKLYVVQDIFSFFFRQLATGLKAGTNGPYYIQYFYLLESLSSVKSVVLVCDLDDAEDLMFEVFRDFFELLRYGSLYFCSVLRSSMHEQTRHGQERGAFHVGNTDCACRRDCNALTTSLGYPYAALHLENGCELQSTCPLRIKLTNLL